MDDKIEIQKAEKLYIDGNIEDAISLFHTVISNNPENYVAYNNLGVIYYEQGNTNKAEELFKNALSIKKDYPDALLNIADHYQNNKKFTEAAEYLERLLGGNNRDVNIYNRTATLYLEAGNKKKAREILSQSLNINPNQESIKESIKHLEKSVTLSSDSEETIILHIMILDKFLPPLIDFIDEHFGRKNHKYIFIDKERYEYGLTPEHNVKFLSTIDGIFITLLDHMKKADKIILHGLWRAEVDLLLYFNQDLAKKCYWVMWGGDYYFPERHTLIRKKIIKKIGHVITSSAGDYELVKKWYGTEAERHNSFCYLSNVVADYSHIKADSKSNNDKKLILIGNSADPTNNHFEILEKISIFKNDNIEIICPLSYGDHTYAKKVIETGSAIFGSKFTPLSNFIPFEEYLKILMTVDVAIFAHKRRQAMGNIRTLLGMGKKVYIRDDITSWRTFEDIDVRVYSFNNEKIDFNFSDQLKNKNIKNIKEAHSYERLLSDWDKILND